jgi:hypothetical protein
MNKIDARFFNLETGLFIDITALSPSREGVLSTKCPHHYLYDEIYPLRKSSFEGIEVNVPNCVEKLLMDEYGEGVRSSRHRHWSFNPDSRCWEQDR